MKTAIPSIDEIKAKIAARRAAHSSLDKFPVIQKIIRKAARLRDPLVRHQVQAVIQSGLDNADDSAWDSYGVREQLDYPNRADFWEAMFYSSAQGASCERQIAGAELHGTARNWLAHRCLMG
jgi:hypothetical protein